MFYLRVQNKENREKILTAVADEGYSVRVLKKEIPHFGQDRYIEISVTSDDLANFQKIVLERSNHRIPPRPGETE